MSATPKLSIYQNKSDRYALSARIDLTADDNNLRLRNSPGKIRWKSDFPITGFDYQCALKECPLKICLNV